MTILDDSSDGTVVPVVRQREHVTSRSSSGTTKDIPGQSQSTSARSGKGLNLSNFATPLFTDAVCIDLM